MYTIKNYNVHFSFCFLSSVSAFLASCMLSKYCTTKVYLQTKLIHFKKCDALGMVLYEAN